MQLWCTSHNAQDARVMSSEQQRSFLESKDTRVVSSNGGLSPKMWTATAHACYKRKLAGKRHRWTTSSYSPFLEAVLFALVADPTCSNQKHVGHLIRSPWLLEAYTTYSAALQMLINDPFCKGKLAQRRHQYLPPYFSTLTPSAAMDTYSVALAATRSIFLFVPENWRSRTFTSYSGCWVRRTIPQVFRADVRQGNRTWNNSSYSLWNLWIY